MARSKSTPSKVTAFDFRPGRVLARKYEVIERVGRGYEGEVYRLRELGADIDRAGKFFFPHRNVRDNALNRQARKLHRLRDCPILVQYRTRETITHKRQPVSCLISDLVDGESFAQFVRRHPGRRLPPFEALHLVYALASGLEDIHERGEYHGDLHSDNVIVRRRGIGFEVKLIDFYHWGPPSRANIQNDVYYLVRLLYEAVGGQPHYARQPRAIKEICCGVKSNLIARKYHTAGDVRRRLERLDWDE